MENEKIFQVDVYVTTKGGVPNPEADALTQGLHELGFVNAQVLRVGKTIRLFVASETQEEVGDTASKASEKLLANPVYQQFEVGIPNEISKDVASMFNME